MSADLPTVRPEPSLAQIYVGAPVRGRLGRELSQMLAWVRGHGMCIIPAHRVGAVPVVGTDLTLRYRVEPQGHAISRFWILRGYNYPLPHPSAMTVTLPSGQTATVQTAQQGGRLIEQTYLIREDLTAKSAAEQEIAITISTTLGTVERLWSVACWEMPRTQLTLDAYDRGVDSLTFDPGSAIYDSDYYSMGALAEHWPRTWPRRSLVQWSGPALEVTGTTFVDLTELSEPCFPHKQYRDSTHHSCKWSVYYWTDAGTSGQVRITTDIDGNTQTLNLDEDTSGGWVTGSISIQCEDPGRSDGLAAGGAWEGVKFAARAIGGGTVYIASKAVWEPVRSLSYLMAEDGTYILQEDGSRITIEGSVNMYYLLAEDGSYLLQEDGNRILLEE